MEIDISEVEMNIIRNALFVQMLTMKKLLKIVTSQEYKDMLENEINLLQILYDKYEGIEILD
jgi:hypothetical protein